MPQYKSMTNDYALQMSNYVQHDFLYEINVVIILQQQQNNKTQFSVLAMLARVILHICVVDLIRKMSACAMFVIIQSYQTHNKML